MKRIAISLALSLIFGSTLWADEGQKEQAAAPSSVAKLKADANDEAALNAYMSENVRKFTALYLRQPDEAEKLLDQIETFLGELKPDTESAQRQLARAKSVIRSYRSRIEIARTSFEELAKKIEDNPDDQQSISSYLTKVIQETGPIARSQPDKAETLLAAAREVLNKAKSSAKQETTIRAIEGRLRTLDSLQRSIDSGKKLAALIGADAAPFAAEAWANGSPLTADDLKGKVVLLDFWAVWCGPCIATFPHLREWHEKYRDKDLVMIGVTRYYNYAWDEGAGRATRSQSPVAAEDELKMLEEFAEHHQLHHRFAIQKGNELSQYYGVTGIPQVVVIDQEGKVRLIRVGSGDQNAQDIAEMLENLLGS